jgi:hypothetical protein
MRQGMAVDKLFRKKDEYSDNSILQLNNSPTMA